jgi:hypothetical protein
VREIRTPGSPWEDEFKKPCSLGEGTGMKMSDNSEAPKRANASRLVSTTLFVLWVERWRRQEARGDRIVVRYADDLVADFERQDDAHPSSMECVCNLRHSRCRSLRTRSA